jgi:hypothetical protein
MHSGTHTTTDPLIIIITAAYTYGTMLLYGHSGSAQNSLNNYMHYNIVQLLILTNISVTKLNTDGNND